MSNEELRTLLSIYLNPELESKEEIEQNLSESGVDAEIFINTIMNKLEEAEANERLKNGERFRDKFYEMLKEINGSKEEELPDAVSFGFRSLLSELSNEEKSELERDKKKLALLKKISGDNERNSKS